MRATHTLGTASALSCLLVAACGGGGDEPPPPDLQISPPTGELQCEPGAEIDCAIDVGERLPLVVTGTTEGREDGYDGASCGLGGATIEDIAFRWTAPRADTYHVDTSGSRFDTFVSVRNGSCAGREIACNDDASGTGPHSSLELPLSKCQTVTIVVDGHGVEDVGRFRLTLTGAETVCDDGDDGDGDGATDCEDDDCFGPDCPGEDSWPSEWAELEWDALQEVNARRAEGASCGGEPYEPAPPLEMNRPLRRAARLHSQDMADNDYFSHDSLDGRTVDDRVAEAGFAGSGPLGENILQGVADPVEAVDGWMSSPDHCRNIMNPTYRVTGIGFADGAGGPRWTQDFAGSD